MDRKETKLLLKKRKLKLEYRNLKDCEVCEGKGSCGHCSVRCEVCDGEGKDQEALKAFDKRHPDLCGWDWIEMRG